MSDRGKIGIKAKSRIDRLFNLEIRKKKLIHLIETL
jgi:hypothetical protein